MSLKSTSSELVLVDLADWASSSVDGLAPFDVQSASEFADSEDCIDTDDFSFEDLAIRPPYVAISTDDSASLMSSIQHQTVFNGRRYYTHQAERYPLPIDDIEKDREDMKHFMMLELTDGKHFLAPLGDDPRRILDLGTGTGIWAIEVGDLCPDAAVIGVDLSPTQPRWCPPNVNFYIDDLEDEWLNGADFDLIHARHVCPFITKPTDLLKRCFENLKPGGWIELQDLDYLASINSSSSSDRTTSNIEDYPVSQFLQLASALWADLGADMQIAPGLGNLLEQVGFVNVRCTTYEIPIGTWPEEEKLRTLGTYLGIVLDLVIPAVCRNPTIAPLWDEDETQAFVEKCRRSIRENAVHAYMRCFFWTAQKPV